MALAVLIVVRIFFSIIEGLGGVLTWRVYAKRETVKRQLALLRENKFPKREYAHDDFTSYLARIIDPESEYSAAQKATAKEIQVVLAAVESVGGLLGMRLHAATDAALDIYSPASEAPSI